MAQLPDHVQNELLRHRNEKSKLPGWSADPFKVALDAIVGDLLDPAAPALRLLESEGCCGIRCP